jgi:hypothetical protein
MTDTPVKRRTTNADRAAARAARDAAEAAKPKLGRPTSFTLEVKDEILRRLEAGETLMKICEDPHLPTDWSVRRYARTDATFSVDLVRAREAQAEAWGDAIIAIADDSSKDWVDHTFGKNTYRKVDREAIDRSKTRIDVRKWLTERFLPRMFSQDATKLDPANPGDVTELIKADQTVIAPDSPGPKDPIL